VREPRYILDAGPLIAYIDRRDQHHAWAVEVLSSLGSPPVTCEPVLTEVCWLLRHYREAVDRVLRMPAQGDLIVRNLLDNDRGELAGKMARYWPQMDLADACVVRLAELYPRSRVITTDVTDFTVYRRADGETIPLLHP
jgi:uncharacterized protein